VVLGAGRYKEQPLWSQRDRRGRLQKAGPTGAGDDETLGKDAKILSWLLPPDSERRPYTGGEPLVTCGEVILVELM